MATGGNGTLENSSAGDSGAILGNPAADTFSGFHPLYKIKYPKKFAGTFKKDRKKDMSVKEAKHQFEKKV